MNWENKVELVTLLNNEKYEEAFDTVIKNLSQMDEQAWDMFFAGLSLSEVSSVPKEKHLKIAEAVKLLKFSSMRTAMRVSMYEEIVSKL